VLSVEGDYLATMDDNGTLALFSNSPFFIDDEIHPRWTYPLRNGTIAGVYSTGGMPPLVYILATVGRRIQLISNRDGLVWEYETEATAAAAKMSVRGRWIAVADANGGIHLFSINGAEPVWKVTTGLIDPDLALSPDNEYVAVGGTTKEGGGQVKVLSLDEGKILWEWQTDGPIRYVSISIGGSRLVAYGGGDAFVLRHKGGDVEENAIRVDGGVESLWAPPFGSYVLALNPLGCLYFFYLPRAAPLWKYDVGSAAPLVAVTSTGEHVFIATQHEIDIVSNTFQTGFIPGSRGLWGVVFFVGAMGALVAIFAVKKSSLIDAMHGVYPGILLGFFAGVVIGLVYYRNVEVIFIGGVGCAIGSLFGWRRGGLLNLLAGCFVGVGGSLFTGYIIGLLHWFSGSESNIIALTLLNAIGGGRWGVLFGVMGVVLGLLAREVGSRLWPDRP